MATRHWSEEDLLNRLYEVGPDDAHLGECQDCRQKWEQLLARRQAVADLTPVSEAFLREQRLAILSRIEKPSRWHFGLRVAPAVATLSMLLAAVFLWQPAPAPGPTVAASDSRLFSEIYSMIEVSEAHAATPIRDLFEESQ